MRCELSYFIVERPHWRQIQTNNALNGFCRRTRSRIGILPRRSNSAITSDPPLLGHGQLNQRGTNARLGRREARRHLREVSRYHVFVFMSQIGISGRHSNDAVYGNFVCKLRLTPFAV